MNFKVKLNLVVLSVCFVFAGQASLANASSSAYIVSGPWDYVITKTEPGQNAPRHISASHQTNDWTGYFALTRTPDYKMIQEMVFEFETEDYFSSNNVGHWAFGIRADAITDATGDGTPDVRGRGIVMGRMLYYPNNPPCGPMQQLNAIAMEAFWADGNCVYGPSTEGAVLENGERYRVQVISREDNVHAGTLINEYRLWKLSSGGSWVQLSHESYGGPSWDNTAPLDLSGHFGLEVFSSHTWTFNIYNFTTYECNSSATQCSGIQ